MFDCFLKRRRLLVNYSAGKHDRDPYPSPECSKVAVGGRELWISKRAKHVSGSLNEGKNIKNS